MKTQLAALFSVRNEKGNVTPVEVQTLTDHRSAVNNVIVVKKKQVVFFNMQQKTYATKI